MKIDTAGFRQKQLESIFNSNEYIKAIQDMVIALEREAKIAPNEKTIETRFDQYLTLIFDQLFYSQDILYRQ